MWHIFTLGIIQQIRLSLKPDLGQEPARSRRAPKKMANNDIGLSQGWPGTVWSVACHSVSLNQQWWPSRDDRPDRDCSGDGGLALIALF